MKNGVIGYIVLGLVLVATTIGIGFWYTTEQEPTSPNQNLQTNSGTEALQPQAKEQQIPAMSVYISSLSKTKLPPSPRDTSTWPTYRRDGLSFQYDPSWNLSEVPGSTADDILIMSERDNVNITIGIFHKNQTVDELVRAHLQQPCNGCYFRDPVVQTLPHGNYVAEVYAYDTGNKTDMRPGVFYFGDETKQFFLQSDGDGNATTAVLNTLSF